MKREDFLLIAALVIAGLRFLPIGGLLPVEKQHGACVCIVEEPTDRSTSMAILANSNYWKSLEARGLDWQFYPPDTKDMPGIAREGVKAGIPAVVIHNDGKLLHAESIKGKETASQVDAIVRRVTGL